MDESTREEVAAAATPSIVKPCADAPKKWSSALGAAAATRRAREEREDCRKMGLHLLLALAEQLGRGGGAEGTRERRQRQVEWRAAAIIRRKGRRHLLELAPPPPDAPARGALLEEELVDAVVAIRLGGDDADGEGTLGRARALVLARVVAEQRADRAQQPHVAIDAKPLRRERF